MADTDFYRSMYSDSMLDLAGFQKKSLLKELVSRDSKQGEAAWFDAISPDDEAAATLLSAADGYRKDYEQIGAPTIADWVNIQTPHTEIAKERTLCLPTIIETGYTFKSPDAVAQGWKEDSDVMRQLNKRTVKQEDNLILASLFAATQARGKDQASLANVAFPAGQILSPTTTLTKEIINAVRTKFEQNYCDDEEIFLGITPEMKQNLIDTDVDHIHNSDFVTHKGYFEKGLLPDIFGVHLVVHQLITAYPGTTTNNQCVAWARDGIMYNSFRGKEVALDNAITQKNQSIFYCSEFAGACRRDDSRVVSVQMGV